MCSQWETGDLMSITLGSPCSCTSRERGALDLQGGETPFLKPSACALCWDTGQREMDAGDAEKPIRSRQGTLAGG